MIAAICLGFFGSVFALVGMKCTKIGGSDQNKAKIACFAGIDFILSGESKWPINGLIFFFDDKNSYLFIYFFLFFAGLCSLSACSLYAHRITSEFFDPMFVAQK